MNRRSDLLGFFFRCGTLSAIAATLVFGSACKPKAEAEPVPEPEEDTTSTAPPASTPKTTGTSAPVPATPFDATVAQLDMGGEVFAYQELDGLAQKIGTGINEIMKITAAEAPVPPELADLDVAGLLDDLGLTGVSAGGISSLKKGDRYINKLYLHTPSGRDGILRLLGREPAPFVSATTAPAGSDLVIERELNLSEAYRIGRDVSKRVMGDEGEKQWQMQAGQLAGNFGVGVADLFRKLDARVTMITRFDESGEMQLPGPDGMITTPKLELFLALDGMGFLFDQLLKTIPPEAAASAVKKGDEFTTIELPPHPLFGEVIIRKNKADGRIIAAFPPSFYEECTAGKGGLFASPEFKSVTAGLPEEGNGLVYISEDSGKLIRGLVAQTMNADDDALALFKRVEPLVMQVLPLAEGKYAGVSVNLPTGMLNVTNSPASWKHAAALPPVLIGAILTASMKTVSRVEEKAGNVRVRADIDALLTASITYQIEVGRFPTTEEGLLAFVEKPPGATKWQQTLAAPLLDPWGNEYAYFFPPRTGRRDRPEIFSAGPDLVRDTEDDIRHSR